VTRFSAAELRGRGAAERPPAEVLAARPPRRPGRNDPCACGSGEKWKKCHGRDLTA
jgi:preprotein translocase subunit SecA